MEAVESASTCTPRAGVISAQLPLRVALHNDEPALSLLVRLAVRYQYSHLSDFLRHTGHGFRLAHDVRNGRRLSEVAVLSGRCATQLESATIVPCAVGWKLADEIVGVGRTPVFKSKARICPLCISDDRAKDDFPVSTRAYRRSSWDLGAIRHCLVHRTELVGRCPRCSQYLERDTADVGVCKCRYDLARCNVSMVDPSSLDADEYLLGRLGGAPRVEHTVLDELTFADAGILLGHLSRCAPDLRVLGPESRLEDRGRTWAFHALQAWPDRFSAALDELSGRGFRRPGQTHKQYQKLRENADIFRKRWGRVGDYIYKHMVERTACNKWKDKYGVPKISDNWLRLDQIAARCLGRSEAIGIGVHLGLIDTSREWSDSVCIPMEHAEEVFTFLVRHVRLIRFTKELGFSTGVLYNSGIINLLECIRLKGCPSVFIRLDELVRWRSSFTPVPFGEMEERTSLRSIREAVRECRVTQYSVIKAILRRKIRVRRVETSPKGVRTFFVSREEVSEHFASQVRPVQRP